jgi:hypothetical protein
MNPPPRWAFVAAYAVPLCVAPSAIWRLTLLAEEDMTAESWYLITLSVVSMGLALLTTGLVHRWGERAPVRAWPVAVTGALLLIAITLYAILNAVFGFVERGPVLIGSDTVQRPEPTMGILVFYLPLLLWGPLVLAVALDNRRRTRAR